MLTPHYEINLLSAEHAQLEALLRAGKTPQPLATRAAIILLAQDGLPNQQLADAVGTSRTLGQKWRKRFALFVAPASVATEAAIGSPAAPPSRICPGRVARRFFPPLARHTVVAVACQGTEERECGGFSHYRGRDLARLVEGRGESLTMSPATVQRIVAALVLNPHRVRYFLTRPDPQFEEQRAASIALYLPPPRQSFEG